MVVKKGDSINDFLKACRDTARASDIRSRHNDSSAELGLQRPHMGFGLRSRNRVYIGSAPVLGMRALACVCVAVGWREVHLSLSAVCALQLSPDFRELRNISVSNLMYVKEDLIIPPQYTFYDLIINKVRHRSHELTFDPVCDQR